MEGTPCFGVIFFTHADVRGRKETARCGTRPNRHPDRQDRPDEFPGNLRALHASCRERGWPPVPLVLQGISEGCWPRERLRRRKSPRHRIAAPGALRSQQRPATARHCKASESCVPFHRSSVYSHERRGTPPHKLFCSCPGGNGRRRSPRGHEAETVLARQAFRPAARRPQPECFRLSPAGFPSLPIVSSHTGNGEVFERLSRSERADCAALPEDETGETTGSSPTTLAALGKPCP